jgi:hypothetical protein
MTRGDLGIDVVEPMFDKVIMAIKGLNNTKFQGPTE